MSMTKYASLGAASLLAAAVFAGPALADGLPSRGRVASPPPESRGCATTANVGLTTDYVFRGISQSAEEPAVQGGVDFSCGRFYFGVWGSSIDFDGAASAEVDIYGGFKHTTGPINWDFGLIYYAYAGRFTDDLDFLELKVGASASLWKGGTVGATVFYSPEGQGDVGPVWTVEGTLAHTLPNVGMFTPTLGATLGHVDASDIDFDYNYWNIGLTLGFLEKWSLDVRYWDTDIDGGCNVGSGIRLCDERIVGTVKYTF
jgi:uncharacterized protein (TIGR02001 family)